MKKLARCAIAGLLPYLVLYLFGAFIAWDFQPGDWPVEGRFFLAMSALLSSLFSAGVVISVEYGAD